MADFVSKFVSKFEVYTRASSNYKKDGDNEGTYQGQKVVEFMTGGLNGKGHIVVIDNF